MKPAKVWGGCYDGNTRWIVAVDSKRQAAELLGVTLGALSSYGCYTKNPAETAIAAKEPGVVFSAPVGWNSEFARGRIRYRRGDQWPPQASA